MDSEKLQDFNRNEERKKKKQGNVAQFLPVLIKILGSSSLTPPVPSGVKGKISESRRQFISENLDDNSL